TPTSSTPTTLATPLAQSSRSTAKPGRIISPLATRESPEMARGEEPRSSPLGRLLPLLDPGGLSTQLSQIVELCPTNLALANHLDFVEAWRVGQEGTLDAHVVGDSANGEGGAGTTAMTAEHDAFELLNALAVAFDNANRDPD